MAAKKVVAKDKVKTTKAKTSSAKVKLEVVKPGPEGRLLLTLPPISDALRSEFRSQRSEAACEVLGKNTSSAGVYREAGQFAVTMHKTLTAHGPAKIGYGLGTMVWFLETTGALGGEITRQQSRNAATGTASLTGKVSVDVAREQRNTLHAQIESVIEGNAALEARFAAVRGGVASEAELIQSLEQSADFAAQLLSEKSALSEEFALTAAGVASARTAAANAKAQRTDRSMEGAVLVNDDAPTNRVEGRVLFEMRRAMRIFNRAAEQGFGTRLVPGPATRHVLDKKATKKKAV